MRIVMARARSFIPGCIFGLSLLGASAGLTSAKAGYEPFIGEIEYFALNFCPKGFLPADGRMMAISQHTALFSLLGTRYGGDGKTNFALPNLESPRTKTGDQLKACVAVMGVFPTHE